MTDAAKEPQGDAVSEYKTILQGVIDSRPSGMRQRLAETLGKNRSFITQISNPAYSTPIPAQHVKRILELCHFSPQERASFLDAYRRAHPRRFSQIASLPADRQVTLQAPDFGDPALNRIYDELLGEMAERIAHLVERSRDEQ